MLTKSAFVLGLRCPRQLWCKYHAPHLLTVSPEVKALGVQGIEVGKIAQTLFDGVEAPFRNGFDATAKLIFDKKTVFEATFQTDREMARVDVLEPNGDSWDIIEVKSSAHVKEDHIFDVAFQKHCANVPIDRCYVMHVDTSYVRTGELDVKRMFKKTDVTDAVNSVPIRELIERAHQILRGPMPTPVLGKECVDPSTCPVCAKNFPPDSVVELYGLGRSAWELVNKGVISLVDVEPETEKQKIQIQTVKSGEAHIETEKIRSFLDGLDYPLHFLDFEAVNPAIPQYDGTRPFQHIPFQLSLHILHSDGTLEHHEYLADSADDPRPAVISALRAIKPHGSILCYSMHFEKNVLKDLGNTFEEDWVLDLNTRIVDLLLVFKNFWYYHPLQRGSCSLKAVLPALCGTSYADMAISGGFQASQAFSAIQQGTATPELRTALLAYCKQDTSGMVEIVRKLRELT